MSRLTFKRITALLVFLILVVGAVVCLQRLSNDIASGKYFSLSEEVRYEVIFLLTYLLLILFALRYGYYLAINRVSWDIIRDDFMFLLNKKYFSKKQWIINVLLFWVTLFSFIYSLAISAMKGDL